MDVVVTKPHLFLGSRLKRLAEQMQADAGLVTQQAGLSIPPGQYPLLVTLDEMGPQTIGGLAQAMGMSQPAITKSAGRLAKAGLVKFERSNADRRQTKVLLTSVGHEVLDEANRSTWAMVEAAVKEVVEDLSGSFLDQIAKIEQRLAKRSLSARARMRGLVLEAATDADVPAIVTLMNLAYRGKGANTSWTTEEGYVTGDRISETLLRKDIASKPKATLLLRRTAESIEACVWLEPLDRETWYLGSLTVDPRRQKAGLGHNLLEAAESWVLERGGQIIRMTVVNIRDTLIAWYQRRGYSLTGETEPFPYNDARFGVPTRDDLHFVVLIKRLA